MVDKSTRVVYITKKGEEFEELDDAERAEARDELDDLIESFHYRGMDSSDIARHLLKDHIQQLETIINKYKVKE